MSIRYYLSENHLTSDQSDFAARVQVISSADLDTIVDRMVDQGSTSTRADIMAVLEDAIKIAEHYIADGHRVTLGGLCQLYPTIKGKFTGIADVFDSSRHTIDVAARPGRRLRKRVRSNTMPEKLEPVTPRPSLPSYLDVATGLLNMQITKGTIGTIEGGKLKFNPLQADEGIYFIDAGDGVTEHKVSLIQSNLPKKLIFLTPSTLISSSNYFIEVRTRYTENGKLRKGQSEVAMEAVD